MTETRCVHCVNNRQICPFSELFDGISRLDCCALQVSEVRAECEMRCELETRFKQIQTRLKAVTQETEEVEYIRPTLSPYMITYFGVCCVEFRVTTYEFKAGLIQDRNCNNFLVQVV